MPWIMQMAAFALMLLGIGLALWVSFWLLLFILGAGLLLTCWGHIKIYLLEKGILNPTPGIPPQEPVEENITVIEADYTRIDDK